MIGISAFFQVQLKSTLNCYIFFHCCCVDDFVSVSAAVVTRLVVVVTFAEVDVVAGDVVVVAGDAVIVVAVGDVVGVVVGDVVGVGGDVVVVVGSFLPVNIFNYISSATLFPVFLLTYLEGTV